MSRFLRFFALFSLVASAAFSVKGFSLLGPFDDWQIRSIGYRRPGDIGGPMNIGEEYRWNVPVLTYGFDESFLNYFGTNGVAEVEKAIAILNALPPASALNVDDYPTEAVRANYRAEALQLYDLKSYALSLLIEEMGLATPERYVWTLRNRVADGTAKTTNWMVIQRNFDPITWEPSSYINEKQYQYTGIALGANPQDDSPIIKLVDPLAYPAISTVAGGGNAQGYFFTSLTRDDVGGLRYMLRPDNYNYERLLPDIEEVFTNTFSPILLTNYDLALLIERSQATTNSPANLSTFYPGIQITGTNFYLTNLIATNVTSYFTNFPYALGAPLEQIYVTNFTTNIVQVFDYSFGNLVTNEFSTTRIVTDRTYEVVPSPNYVPGGSPLQTNILAQTDYLTNVISGSFYVRPTNFLDMIILSNGFTVVELSTNEILNAVSANVAITNTTPPPIALTTLDYSLFIQNTRETTNTPQQVIALYPTLLLTQTNAHLGPLVTTNITSYFTNYPWAPEQVFLTNYTTNVVTFYTYEVGNIVVEPHYSDREILVQTLEIAPASDYSPGNNNIRTNILDSHFETEVIENGEFFIVPTNLLGYAYISNVLTTVTPTTNLDFFAISSLIARTNTSDEERGWLFTLDLATFSEQARTNPPSDLLALYPDLLILQSNRFFTTYVTSNSVFYFTNAPWDPAGSLTLTQQVIYTTNVGTNFNYVFGNVVTNTFSDTGVVILQQDISITDPYAPGGSAPRTESVTQTIVSNFPNGSIYIVPTNLLGYDIINTLFVNVQGITNTQVFTNFDGFGLPQTNTFSIIRFATNYVYEYYPIELLTTNDFGTNFFGLRQERISYATNTTYEVYPIELVSTNELATNVFGTHQELVTYFTNSIAAYYPVQTRAPFYNEALRPGVDKITFIRQGADSLLGTNHLITNIWTDTIVTSNAVSTQTLRRVMTRPDIVFEAQDLAVAPPVLFPSTAARSNTGNWENNDALNGQAGLAGPGVIRPRIAITFNKVGAYFGAGLRNNILSIEDQLPIFRWGSFDGSTNAPVLYPVGSSINELEQRVLTP